MDVDRIRGVLVGTAAGDALGAPYEFGPPRGPDLPVAMTGGGSFAWAPGEWTDDTSMAIAIAEVAATGSDLRADDAQDAIVARWVAWAEAAPDVGNQTRTVLSQATTAADARRVARELHERTGHTGGNGSLMRTAPVVLAHLDDDDALADAAAAIGLLTHVDPDAVEACVLWCLAMAHAVRTGELDVRVGLPRLPDERREVWAARIVTAEASAPADFRNNGWVVEALQAAWSAIATSAEQSLPGALEAAVRGGRDADTVAAIAGGLLGAAYGESGVPDEWRRVLHGWPGLRADDLGSLAEAIVHASKERTA